MAPMRLDLPTGTVTFLFTDIQGSTKLLQRLGDAYAQALGEHQALLRQAFADHHGVEVDTQGDSFFVAFPTAPHAVAAAVQATRALTAHAWPEGVTLRVRMGLHTGSPLFTGERYVGMDVNRAARIAASGHGGQILLSQTTHALVSQNLPADCTLRDLGAHRLKDLQHPEAIYQLILPDADLPNDFPPLKTLDTHQHNLPVQPTLLLGRAEQLAAISALLRRDDVRLVTLTGPGGIGKTRLAIQVAAELVDEYPDGVWFVRLSRLTDPALVLPATAQALGLSETPERPISETLQAYLANKRLLLALDNFEQVMAAAAALGELLSHCPNLTLLVTSRAPLRLRAEHEYPLIPLPLPDPGHLPPPEQLSQFAAVALFVERAQAAKPDFAITASNAPAIAEICARLDGLPLAIELAAARIRLLAPEAMLPRLSGRLKLLTGGARDLEARQQTMHAAIGWSEALLTPQEQMLFRRLAVFVGGATLEAVEAVCLAPEGAEPLEIDPLDGLEVLVDQNLVQQREEGGEPRFGMLHIIREYALERLEVETASGGQPEVVALRRAHATWTLTQVEQAEPEMNAGDRRIWFERLAREHDNLRAALGWAREQGETEMALRIVGAVWQFWLARGYLREGRAWAEEALAAASGNWRKTGAAARSGGPQATADRDVMNADVVTGADDLRARALLAAGSLAMVQNDENAATNWLEQSALIGAQHTKARALNNLGVLALSHGDLDRAALCYEESLALFREMDEPLGLAAGLLILGSLAWQQDDLERASAYYAEALTCFRDLKAQSGIALALGNLCLVALKRGEIAQAEALGRESLALRQELGDLLRCAVALESLARVAAAEGQSERAAQLLGAATALREEIDAPQSPIEQAELEQEMSPAREAMGEDEWAVAFAAGQALDMEKAIALVFETFPTPEQTR